MFSRSRATLSRCGGMNGAFYLGGAVLSLVLLGLGVASPARALESTSTVNLSGASIEALASAIATQSLTVSGTVPVDVESMPAVALEASTTLSLSDTLTVDPWRTLDADPLVPSALVALLSVSLGFMLGVDIVRGQRS